MGAEEVVAAVAVAAVHTIVVDRTAVADRTVVAVDRTAVAAVEEAAHTVAVLQLLPPVAPLGRVTADGKVTIDRLTHFGKAWFFCYDLIVHHTIPLRNM